MSFLRKRQPAPRTDDERLKSLSVIRRSYASVTVYGDTPLSPKRLEERIGTAYEDMTHLIAENASLRDGWMKAECDGWQLAHNSPPGLDCDDCVYDPLKKKYCDPVRKAVEG